MGQNDSKFGEEGEMATPRSLPLSEEQMSNLPEDVKEAFRNYASEQATLEAELKAKYERLRVDSEQKYFELEQLQRSEHDRLETESKSASELRLFVSDLEKRHNEVSEKYRELQKNYFEKDKQWNGEEQLLLQKNSSLELERMDLIELLNKRNAEVDRLTDESRLVSGRLSEEIQSRLAAQTKADEAKSEMMILQHRDGRLQQELNHLRQQNDILNEQIQERFNEIMAVRKEKSLRLVELQGLLDNSTAQVTHLEQSLETSKVTQAEQNQQIESYIEKLREARDGHIQMEEQYRNELVAQEKLINLYKVASSEAEKKVEEMAKAVEELQTLLSQATEAYSELKSEKEELAGVTHQQLTDRDGRIRELETELVRANELLEMMKKKAPSYISEEDAQAISPAAAAASRLLKSGMTLTQIYSEYAETLNQLQLEKEENGRLTSYLDNILQEIEEKAPLIKKQKVDYEESLDMVDRLTHQLDAALLDCEKSQQAADESLRRSSDLRRQNERYAVQMKDLSLQVRMLLKELEEARGSVVQMADDESYSDEVSSSSHLISEKLVSFRSIEELHEQNLKLLQVVRELSEAGEAKERGQMRNDEDSQRVVELEEQLERALADMEEMRAARERQAGLVDSLIQQRDMYRTMATTFQPPTPPIRSPPVPIRSPVTSAPGVLPLTPATVAPGGLGEEDQKVLQETRTALKELHEEFSVYRREKGNNEKMLNEQLEKVNREASDFRLQNAKLASQLSFSTERYKMLQSNSESHKKEIEALRDKNQKLSDSMIRHQQTITLLREEMKTIQDKLSSAEIRNQNLLTEKEMLRSMESRLSSELESVRRDNQSRDMLMNNLQAIQNNLERSDFETKTKLGQRIESLERENTVLRKKAEGTDEQQRAFIITLERQLSEARTDVDVEKSKTQRLLEQLSTADSHIAHLNEELSAAESRLAANEMKLNEMSQLVRDLQSQIDPSQKLTEEIQDLKTRLDEAQSEIKNLTEKLDQSKRNADQYKSIADGMERSLKEQNEASKQFRESLEVQLNETRQVKDLLEAELKEIEVERLRLFEENVALRSDKEQAVTEKMQLVANNSQSGAVSLERIAQLEKELCEAIDTRDVAMANEVVARSDCEAQAREAREAQSNYERELMLHAADVETLSRVKQELEFFNAKLSAAEAEAKEANSLRAAAQDSWTEQESVLQRELSALRERMTSLHSQNTMLHQELEKMSEQMLQMQSVKEREETHGKQMAEAVDKDANPKTPDQLLEVIRYLRREKELTEAKHGIIEAEANRLRQQVTLLRRHAESAEQSLAQELEKNAIKVETAAQHAELMRKVETLNLLQDSNQLLRSEKERMFQQVKELEAKNSRLEAELDPLKEMTNEVAAQRDASRREVEILMGEVERWKSRTSHLIEQCNKYDPEELKTALDDRDQLKRQLETISEESQALRNEVSRLKEQLVAAQMEAASTREETQQLSTQLAEIKSSIAAKDADEEEKTKTIAQLRKIGRKYRMQAEETQKELEELKAKAVEAANTELNEKMKKAEEDLVHLQLRQKETETQAAEANARLQSVEHERNEALKQMKNAEERERELGDQLTKLKQELSKASEERSNMADTHLKSVEEKGKVMDDFRRLTEENKSLREEREKADEEKTRTAEENRKMSEQMKELEKRHVMTRNLVLNAKQRLEDRKAEMEKVTAENQEMRRKIEADKEEMTRMTTEAEDLRQRLDQQTSAEEMELRMSTLKSQFEGKIVRLERELGEQTSARTAEAEAAERLRRDNQELQQRVNLLQNQIESFQRQIGQSPSKPTISAPPVERSGPGSADVSQQRRTYIKPMPTAAQTAPQRHSAPVQPVRSTAGVTAETRAMVASIRPMAVASTQPTTTPMATVMPTTMSLPENEGLPAPNVLSQSTTATASTAGVMSQGRPTQQVQPVSSHFEESTVSSSEEPVLEGMQQQPIASWWLEHVTPSTSSEHAALPSGGGGGTSSSSSGITNKRPREETRQQEESTDNENEAPTKRSKMQTGEAADTTETTNAVTEVEREAASVAQMGDNQQQTSAEMRRRELEPVSTSLAAMDEGLGGSHRTGSDVVQDEDSRKRPSMDQAQGLATLPSDDLPDYQETEASATEYDIRPSTSRQHGSDVDEQSNQESINQSEPRDDAEEAAAEVQPQDDVICVEEEDEDDEEDMGPECMERTGGVEYQVENSEEEEEEEYNQVYPEEVEDIDDDEFEVDDKEDGAGEEDIYEGMEATEIQVEGEESTNDVIVVDDEAVAGTDADGNGKEDAVQVVQPDDNLVPMSAVSTSQPHQVMHRHPGQSSIRLANAPSSDAGGAGGALRVNPHLTSSSAAAAAVGRSTGSSQMDRVPMTSRAQLMPFIFGVSDTGSGGFEIGDDGIVPSTPTLQISVRTDGFAEAVSSPQVTEEFMFGSSSESVPQLELAQQRGIGVDDTRMDLSQFDEQGSRGLLMTPPCSQTSSPAFQGASHHHLLSPEHFHDQTQDPPPHPSKAMTERSGPDTGRFNDPLLSCTSQTSLTQSTGGSRSQTPIPLEDHSSQDDQRPAAAAAASSDTSSADNRQAVGGADDRPSTSESSNLDRPEAHAQSKPKIKKIVWQEPNSQESSSSYGPGGGGGVGPSSSSTQLQQQQQPQVSSQQQQQLTPQPGTSSQPRRGYVRGGYRGSRGAMAQQQQVRPLLSVPMVPPQAHSPQVARRARGGSRASTAVWSTRQQQHYQ